MHKIAMWGVLSPVLYLLATFYSTQGAQTHILNLHVSGINNSNSPGLAGLVGLVGYGIYGFKNRKVKMSVYLIHMRVMAQGCVVLCLTAGVGYNLYLRHIQSKLNPPSIEEKKE